MTTRAPLVNVAGRIAELPAGDSLAIAGLIASGGYTQSGTDANTITGTTTFNNATYSALFTGGNVGIGTATPSQLLDIASGRALMTGTVSLSSVQTSIFGVTATLSGSANGQASIRVRNAITTSATGNVAGIDVVPTFTTSANITNARGSLFGGIFNPATATTLANADGANYVVQYGASAAGAITNSAIITVNSPQQNGSVYPTTMYGIHIQNTGLAGMTTNYGLYVDAQSGASTNYGIYNAGTSAFVGDTTFSARANLKSYTVATLPAAGVAGGIVYCSNAGGNGPCIAMSDGTNWKRCDNVSTTVV